MKRTIKLRESELKRMIAESVNRTLNEGYFGDFSGNYDDGFYEFQELFVLYKTLVEIRDVVERLVDIDNQSKGFLNSNISSAIFHIKKGLELLETDRIMKKRSRYFDNLQVSVDINGYKE